MSRLRRFVQREVTANIRAYRLVFVASMLVVGLLSAGAVAWSGAESRGAVDAWISQEQAGRSVFAVMPVGSGIDAAECDSASGIAGVRAAGGILGTSDVHLSVSVMPTTMLRVTRGFIAAVWWTPQQFAGVGVSVELADRYGLEAGSRLGVTWSDQDDGGPHDVTVEWAATRPAFVPGIDDALLVTAAPIGTVPVCYVAAAPENRASVGAALAGWFSHDVQARPAFAPSATTAHPDADYALRPSIVGGIAAALLLVVVQWGVAYLRRSDFALYRVLGLRRRDLARILVREAALTVALPALVGGAAAVWIVWPQHCEVLLPMVLTWLTVLAGTVLGAGVVCGHFTRDNVAAHVHGA